jgi:hypothetical protein
MICIAMEEQVPRRRHVLETRPMAEAQARDR